MIGILCLLQLLRNIFVICIVLSYKFLKKVFQLLNCQKEETLGWKLQFWRMQGNSSQLEKKNLLITWKELSWNIRYNMREWGPFQIRNNPLLKVSSIYFFQIYKIKGTRARNKTTIRNFNIYFYETRNKNINKNVKM